MIRRFFPIQDTTITNAYDPYFIERKTEANLGGSDILETCVLYDRNEEGEYELSRILLKFDIADIVSKMTATELAGAGCYLRLFNAAHGETLPDNFTLNVYRMTRHWTEGIGLDFEGLEDTGGASWLTFDTTPDGDPRPTTNDWSVAGGDYNNAEVKSCTFLVGDEDLYVNISDWFGEWTRQAAPVTHYGLLIKFPNASETTGAVSEYTKRFFARLSQYFYKRPVLEVVYEDNTATEYDYTRNHFEKSSVLYNSPSNYLYYHNKPRGFYEDVPGYIADNGEGDPEPQLTVVLYDEDGDVIGTSYDADHIATGLYRIAADIPSSYVFDTAIDKWYRLEDLENPIYTGLITLECPHDGTEEVLEVKKAKLSMREVKPFYTTDEICKFKVDAVDLNWNPNVYVSFYNDGRNTKLRLTDTYYKVVRKIDNFTVIEYSILAETPSSYTKLSYNEEYNFFTLYFDMFEPGYMYEIRFMTVFDWGRYEHPEKFKFRIDDPTKFRF